MYFNSVFYKVLSFMTQQESSLLVQLLTGCVQYVLYGSVVEADNTLITVMTSWNKRKYTIVIYMYQYGQFKFQSHVNVLLNGWLV